MEATVPSDEIGRYGLNVEWGASEGNWGEVKATVHSPKMEMPLVMSNVWSCERIEEVEIILEDFIASGRTLGELVDFSRAIGSLTSNQNLCEDSQSHKNLWHMRGLLKLAKKLLSQGNIVHLIESCGPDLVSKFVDVDLLVSFNGMPHLVDYSNSAMGAWEEMEGILVYTSGSKDLTGKLDVLKSKISPKHISSVMKMEVEPVKAVEMKMPPVRCDEFSSEFKKVDDYINLYQSLTVKEVDEIVAAGMENINAITGKKGAVKTEKRFPKRQPSFKITDCLKENSEKSGAFLDEVMGDMSLAGSTPKHYSRWFYSKHSGEEGGPLGSVSQIPYMEGGAKAKTAWGRLEEISRTLEEDGLPTNYMLESLLLCVDEEYHPNEEELAVLCEKDLEDVTLVGSFQVKRISSGIGDDRMFIMKTTKGEKDLGGFLMGKENKTATPEVSKARNAMCAFRDSFNTVQPCNGLEAAEKIQKDFNNVFATPEAGGLASKILSKLIKNCGIEGSVGDLTREILSNTLEHHVRTVGFNWVEGVQSLSESMSSMSKKRRHYKTGSLKSNETCFHLEPIADKMAMVISNCNYSYKDVGSSAMVLGVLREVDTSGLYIHRHGMSMTQWFSRNLEKNDWEIGFVGKVLSYVSMEYETRLGSTKNSIKNIINPNYSCSVFTLLVNKSTFSQAAEMVRYLFVNSSGISNGTAELYEKVRFYTSPSITERLYMLRMYKISTMLDGLSAMGKKDEAIVSVSVSSFANKEPIFLNKKAWAIAMPHSTDYVPNDRHVFNSFYLCKALCVSRGNTLVSEAMVFNKQCESRLAYLEERGKQMPSSLTNLEPATTKERLLEVNKELLWKDESGGRWNSCFLTVMISGCVSILECTNQDPASTTRISEIVKEDYKLEKTISSMHISELMNSKASISQVGKQDVEPDRDWSVKGEKKTVRGNNRPNDKCYKTILKGYSSFLKDEKCYDYRNEDKEELGRLYKEKNTKDSLTGRDLLEVSMSPGRVWQVLCFNLEKGRPMFCSMFSKDQIGPREIGVMNNVMRIGAYTIEKVARKIRDSEYDLKEFSNLVENDEKQKLVSKLYDEYNEKKKLGDNVMYDNADCSTWGPSMLLYNIYACLSLRMDDSSSRRLLKGASMSFSDKRIKIPSSLAKAALADSKRKFDNPTNAVTKACSYIRSGNTRLVNLNNQTIYASEGMLQGGCNVGSSCLGTDALRLSNRLCVDFFQVNRFSIKGATTSDDSVRISSYVLAEGTHSILDDFYQGATTHYEMVRGSLYVYWFILNKTGIKRNMSKSTHSRYVLELNSVFRTSDGIVVPEIKSRLAYVRYSTSPDMQPSAMEVVSQSADYMRNSGGVIGAMWVGILNSYNHLKKFQLASMYLGGDSDLHTVPLELGGLPRVEPLLAVHGNKMLPLLGNYGGNVDSAVRTLSCLDVPNDEVLEMEDGDFLTAKSRVPKSSRSGLVRLGLREPRAKRQIRDVLTEISDDCFLPLLYRGDGSKTMTSLISCFLRERTTLREESQTKIFGLPQAPAKAKVFSVNTVSLGNLLPKRCNREDLAQAAIVWSNTRAHVETTIGDYKEGDSLDELLRSDVVFTIQEYLGRCPAATSLYSLCAKSVLRSSMSDEEETIYGSLSPILEGEMEAYKEIVSSLSYIDTVPTLRFAETLISRETYIGSSDVQRLVSNFKDDFLPTSLGGTTDMKVLEYLEVSENYARKVKDLSYRRQSFKISVFKEEVGLPLITKLLLSDFMEGTRLNLGGVMNAFEIEKISFPSTVNDFLKLKGYSSYDPYKVTFKERPLRRDIVECRGLIHAPQRLGLTSMYKAAVEENMKPWGGIRNFGHIVQTMSEVLYNLKMALMSKEGEELFYVEPAKLMFSNSYRKLKVLSRTHSVNRVVSANKDLAYVDITTLLSDKTTKNPARYHHSISILRGSCERQQDTRSDSYSYLDLTGVTYLAVELKRGSGSWWLTSESGNKLAYLCEDIKENMVKIALSTDLAGLLSRDDYDRLWDPTTASTELDCEILITVEAPERRLIELGPEMVVPDKGEFETGVELDYDLDDLDDMMEDALGCQAEKKDEEVEEIVIEPAEGSSGYTSSDEESLEVEMFLERVQGGGVTQIDQMFPEEARSMFGACASDYSAMTDSVVENHSLLSSKLIGKLPEAVRRAQVKKGAVSKRNVFVLRLPILVRDAMDKKTYEDQKDQTAVGQLLDDLEENFADDEEELSWTRSYIRSQFLKERDVRAAIIRFTKEKSEVIGPGVMDDYDWLGV